MRTKKIVLSPMAGVTDAPFRFMARKYGVDYTITEMVTSQTNLWDSNKTKQRLQDNFSDSNTIKIMQIVGTSPKMIADAAIKCAHLGANIVEINMGCPAKKVCNVLAGSALLKDEKLVAEILTVVVKAVDIPIFLKTRLGFDNIQQNILNIAQIAEDSGIKSLTIHGRTRCDLYNGEARYELIAKVKQNSKIPIFANGDIDSPEKAKYVLDYTKADGLYIGRGALGRPWLFSQINDYLNNGGYTIPDRKVMCDSILEHLTCIYQHYGDYMGVRMARKHLKWYCQNNTILSYMQQSLGAINQIESNTEQYNMVESILKN
jgi:tRNA-dihydrouridine synthase B